MTFAPAPLFAAARRRGVSDDDLAARLGLTSNALRGTDREAGA